MKVTRTSDDVVLEFAPGEFREFRAVVQLQIQVPPVRQPLSKSGKVPEPESSQRLLDDALAQHRAANRKRLNAWLGDARRLQQTEAGPKLVLSAAEIECLLQILNEVRVGCWHALGSPEEFDPPSEDALTPQFLLMMLSGAFEAQLLEALDGPSPPPSPAHEI